MKDLNEHKPECNKWYGSPRWSGEILDCSMPMTFDTYNKCSGNCLYCFSYFQKGVDNRPVSQRKEGETGHKDYQTGELTWVNPEAIRKMFTGGKSQFEDYIKEKRVMQWGGLADEFDNYERQHGITLKMLEIFDELDYPLSFSTKFTWWTEDERYMRLIRRHPHNWHFKVSIINLNAEKAKVMEKGIPSPQERLEAIRRIVETGCHVTLRLRPFIIGYTNADNEHIKLLQAAKKAGADSITIEFFCLEQRADAHVKARYKEMSKIIGYNIWDFYRIHSKGSGYLRLNYNLKKEYIAELKNEADKLGLRFYVSDAHHKEKSCSGSCCGLPTFMNYSRGQFTEAIIIAKEKGEVKFSDIQKDVELFKKIKWGNACGFNTQSSETRVKRDKWTLYDFIRNRWNEPNNSNSPYKYFNGVLIPDRLDENGDIIYKYDHEKAEIKSTKSDNNRLTE